MITIDKSTFLPALTAAAQVVHAKNTIPILANILLEARDSRLRLTGNCLDFAVVTEIAADVSETIALTLPADAMVAAAKKVEDGGQITIDGPGQGGRVTFRAGRARYQLATLPAEDFPMPAPTKASALRFEVPGRMLARAIAVTERSVSTEETRYYLNGAFIHADGEHLTFVTTDGHRLSRHRMPLPIGAGGMAGLILPMGAFRAITSICTAAGDSPVTITTDESRLSASFGDTTFVTKLIDGTYPDYTRVIPDKPPARVEIDGAVLRDAVERMLIASDLDAGGKARAIAFGADGGVMTLRAGTVGGERSGDIEITCGMLDAAPWSSGFNGRYVLDLVAATGASSLAIHQDDVLAPARIEPRDDPATIHVLMPMRI
ncbi:DNA polymerase III subunit beta [Zavarzinia sp.]|uniref:DNA polymerase III subunit beta n=1 Tax=Zavarzinia sp. TaxID=2027920 RepID=UPI003BB72CA4